MVPRVPALRCVSLSAALSACLAGCAGPGAQPQAGAETPKAVALAPQAALARVAPGRSTKADVEAALGRAATVQFDSDWDVWVYRWRGQQKTSRGDAELVVLFGPDGIARKARVRPPYPPDE